MLEQLLPNVFWPEIWQASLDTLNMLLGSMLSHLFGMGSGMFADIMGLLMNGLLIVTTTKTRALAERRLRAVSRRGKLAYWFDEYGDSDA